MARRAWGSVGPRAAAVALVAVVAASGLAVALRWVSLALAWSFVVLATSLTAAFAISMLQRGRPAAPRTPPDPMVAWVVATGPGWRVAEPVLPPEPPADAAADGVRGP